MTLRIVIMGSPIGQGRPRASFERGRIRMRDPDDSRAAKAAVASHALVAMTRQGWRRTDRPIAMSVVAYFACPKSMAKARSARRELAPRAPDADNIAKLYADALNGVAYEDDRQIVSLDVLKVREVAGCEARVEIEIREADVEDVLRALAPAVPTA